MQSNTIMIGLGWGRTVFWTQHKTASTEGKRQKGPGAGGTREGRYKFTNHEAAGVSSAPATGAGRSTGLPTSSE